MRCMMKCRSPNLGLGRVAAHMLGIAVLTLLLAAPALAAPPLEVTKTVTHVNDAAPAAGNVIAVASGDSVGYAISVSGNPSFGGTDVTITDVFDASVLIFDSASVGGCIATATEVSCTVRLADSGDAKVVLTFRVLDVRDCRRLVNRVEVVAEREATGSAEAEIEACPAPGGVLAGTPSANAAMDAAPPLTRTLLLGVVVIVSLAGAVLALARCPHDLASRRE